MLNNSKQKPNNSMDSSRSAEQKIHLEITPEIPIPTFLTSEIQSKLAYVDEWITSAKVSSDKILVEITPTGTDDKTSSIPEVVKEIEEKIQQVVISMAKGSIKPKIQLLEDYLDRAVYYHSDPMDELFRRGEIGKEAEGIYSLGPFLSGLINYFEILFTDLAKSFEAIPYRFPTLIPARYMERVKYFQSFPHSLTFVTHLREDLNSIDSFAQNATCEGAELNTPLEYFDRIQSLLSPAVCYHLYFLLADKPLPGGKLTATAVGNCFRYESINLNSLERMWNFTMREVIFVGAKDFVLENRENARQRMEKKFEEIGMAYRVESANDPFFIGEFRKQAAFQSAFQLKFEIKAWLPYKNSTLAIGSYNYHQDFFGRSLNITLPNGSPAHTGCVAFGLERIAFAFLAQYGFDLTKWPDQIRSHLTHV